MNTLNFKSKRVQAGFTLIELIIVIVILGVLAATALPKFADLGADARLAKMKAAHGAMSAAAATSHAQWLANGSTATTLTQEGVTITYLNGYPDSPSILLSAGLSSTDYPTIATAASGSPVTISSDTTRTTCSVTYTEATALVGPIVTSAAASSTCK